MERGSSVSAAITRMNGCTAYCGPPQVVMVAPTAFTSNAEAAQDNKFMQGTSGSVTAQVLRGERQLPQITKVQTQQSWARTQSIRPRSQHASVSETRPLPQSSPGCTESSPSTPACKFRSSRTAGSTVRNRFRHRPPLPVLIELGALGRVPLGR